MQQKPDPPGWATPTSESEIASGRGGSKAHGMSPMQRIFLPKIEAARRAMMAATQSSP
jgi:hypothetical protein